MPSEHGLAVVTGASSGIGYELANCCAENGFSNKLQAAMAHLLPAGMLAEQHRKMAAPGTAGT